MSFHSWLQHLRAALPPRRRRRHDKRRGSLHAATHRPSLEVLEDRLTPSFLWPAATYPEAPPEVVWSPMGQKYADFTGDGILDEVNNGWRSVEGNLVTTMVVRPGRSDGTFGDPISTDAPNASSYFAVADFNGDGRPDLFTAAPANWAQDAMPGQGDALLGRGDGSFDLEGSYSLAGISNSIVWPTGIGTGDISGTGRIDVVVAGWTDYSYNTDTFVVFFNDGIWPNTPQLRIGGASVTEGNAGAVDAVFTVTLDNGPDQVVTVNYATSDGSATAGADYQAAAGTLTFAPGETSKTITVQVIGDRLAEPDESFFVNLSGPTNVVISEARGMGTIVDDEPRISITDAAVTEGNTGTRSATFTVTLSSASDVDVMVHYATADIDAVAGGDYTAASGDVAIMAGKTSATFTVAVKGDRLAEGNESFAVDLSAPRNAAIADGRGIGTILDDEPRISISDVTKREGRKNTTQFVFTVTLSAAYDQPVTVSYRTADGSATTGDGDYVAKTGTLTFAPGETTKTITIEVKGDNKRETNVTFFLDLFGNSGNSWFTKSRGLGTILNDD
jgi:hypothetical protein